MALINESISHSRLDISETDLYIMRNGVDKNLCMGMYKERFSFHGKFGDDIAIIINEGMVQKSTCPLQQQFHHLGRVLDAVIVSKLMVQTSAGPPQQQLHHLGRVLDAVIVSKLMVRHQHVLCSNSSIILGSSRTTRLKACRPIRSFSVALSFMFMGCKIALTDGFRASGYIRLHHVMRAYVQDRSGTPLTQVLPGGTSSLAVP